MTPYLPSINLCRQWLQYRIDGLGDEIAWMNAFKSVYGGGIGNCKSNFYKPLARSVIAGAHGQPPLTLSVPVMGGASTVKRDHPEEWLVSGHGRWGKMHIGALAAAYSYTPYFSYCGDELESIIVNVKEGDSFQGFTGKIFNIVKKILDIEDIICELRIIKNYDSGSSWNNLMKFADEKKCSVDAEISFFDVIFKRGKDALFTLLI